MRTLTERPPRVNPVSVQWRWLRRVVWPCLLLPQGASGQLEINIEGHAAAGGTAPIAAAPCTCHADQLASPGAPGRDDDRLRVRHSRLLGVLTDEPQSAQRLARLAGFASCHATVRTTLTDLARWNFAMRSPDGWLLHPSRRCRTVRACSTSCRRASRNAA